VVYPPPANKIKPFPLLRRILKHSTSLIKEGKAGQMQKGTIPERENLVSLLYLFLYQKEIPTRAQVML
jgi:hypothetical protein